MMAKTLYWEAVDVVRKGEAVLADAPPQGLQLWPCYDGHYKAECYTLADELDEEWAHVVVAAFAHYLEAQSAVILQYTYQAEQKPRFNWFGKRRTVAAGYRLSGVLAMDAEFVGLRERYYCGDEVFLIVKADQQTVLPDFLPLEGLRCSALLANAQAILQFAVEEPQLQLVFATDTSAFLHSLEHTAAAWGYGCEVAPQPFVSHWVTANSPMATN